jgi:phage baseplate assembly protein W|tara:strand:+ start:259 stop:666 length:408 start_codon:yes stop_codon:yes gene_type:complete
MAFNAQQIYPIDFNKSAAVGIDIPFNAPSVFRPNYTTKAAIKNNLINYFLTNPGERPLNPEFGGGLRAFIFEQITDNNLDFLEEQISSDLNNFFPNVNVSNLEILKQEDLNTITVLLSYNVINTNINDTLEIDFT